MKAPRVIATCGAAAQKLKKKVWTQLGLFLRPVEALYQISSKSVKKQKSFNILILALIAPQDLSESVNVQKSWFLESRLWNHYLIAEKMLPSIFRLNIYMFVTYCYKTETFFFLSIFLDVGKCRDQHGTIKFVWKWKCLKLINCPFLYSIVISTLFFFLFFSSK